MSMHFKAGCVGRLLPGLEYKLDTVPSVHKGGKLLVTGPNVMLGISSRYKPGVLEAPIEGWHNTGDIIGLDEQGFVKIILPVDKMSIFGTGKINCVGVQTPVHTTLEIRNE